MSLFRQFVITRLVLAMMNLCAKFGLPSFMHSPQNTQEIPKMYKEDHKH